MRHPRSAGTPDARHARFLLLGLLASSFPLAHAHEHESAGDTRLAAIEEQLANQAQLLQQGIANPSRFKVNGYFSAGAIGTDQEGGLYDESAGDDTDFEALSRAALQLEFRIDDDTRFVTQLLSRGSEGWQTRAEWAYLAHDISPSTTVRAGRLRQPLFLYSETLDVGYTQPWVKGPAEMYGILRFSSYEGLDLRHRFTAAGADWSVQPYLGYAKLNSWDGQPGESRGDEMHGIDITAMWGDLTARLGYFGSRLNIPNFGLATVAYRINENVRGSIADGAATSAAGNAAPGAAIGAATQAGSGAATGACAAAGHVDPATCPASVYSPAYNTAYNTVYQSTYQSVYDSTYDTVYSNVSNGLPDPDLSVKDADTRYVSFGLKYESGNWLLLTEYAGSRIKGFFTDLTSCYGTAGYKFGKVMPHVTFSHLRVDDPENRRFSDVAWDPDGPGPAPAQANPGGAFVASAYAIDQQSWTFGVRYDYRPGMALKAEASRIGDFTPGSSGRWVPESSSVPLPDDFWVYRASVDIVF